jgi:hypothetical protein
MDQSLAEKRVMLHDQAQDPVSKRKTQGDLYKEEVKACEAMYFPC